MEEEIKNTTEVAKNASELANNFYADIRPIVQPVTKCFGAVSGDLQFADSSYYDKVIKFHHLDEMKAKYESSHGADNVDYDKGYYHVTEIGKLFIDACCR